MKPTKRETGDRPVDPRLMDEEYYTGPNKTYVGTRIDNGTPRHTCVVDVDGYSLYSVKLDEESIGDVFDWHYSRGYGWKRALNLSASILTDHFETDQFPEELVEMFHNYFVAKFQFWKFELNSQVIEGWLDMVAEEFGKRKEKSLEDSLENPLE